MVYVNFRQASGRPFRWDFMTWAHAESVWRRKLPWSAASVRRVVWEARETAKSEANRLRRADWQRTRAVLDHA